MAAYKNSRLPKFLAIACAGVLSVSISGAQVHFPEQDPVKQLLLADDQFIHQHYLVAAQSAERYLNEAGTSVRPYEIADRESAAYYKVMAGLKHNVTGCVDSAINFASTTISRYYQQRINFAVAQYHFVRRQFKESIVWYERTGIDNLTNSEIADEKFEMAYSYFVTGNFEKARPLFASIKEIADGKYFAEGNYYYGLLSYNDNDFGQALKSFARIENLNGYKSVVPYYIAEVYYFMGDRSKALNLAKVIADGNKGNLYTTEAHLLVAQCYFETQNYTDARPYFEYYYNHSNKIRKEDLYKIGYCYYRLSDWNNAKNKLTPLSDSKDSLGQSSMYILGDCYLKTSDKKSARNAFGICSQMPFNKGQQEASLILYARLSYETGHTDEAKRAANDLLEKFGTGPYKDEARTLLSSLFIKSNDFEGALNYLEGITNKDKLYWQAYQKGNYGRATQLFREGKLEEAITYFSHSLEHPVYETYTNAAYFWKSEIAFRMKQYNETITNARYFLNGKPDLWELEKLSPQATVQHAYLNMGYASLELQENDDAQNYFYQAQHAKGGDRSSAKLAALQEADAVFLQQNFPKAANLYDKIINNDSVNADYARYQKSIILGLQGKNNDKVKELKLLIGKQPASVYKPSAVYELALTYIETNNYPAALEQLSYITDSASDRGPGAKAWLKTGFIHQQTGNLPLAKQAYKNILVLYPASDERATALDALKSIFIQNNDPGGFAKVLKETGLPDAENASVDSTYYAAAEAQYASGKWDNAITSFSNYLKEFPNGLFAIKAHYYRAQSNLQVRKYSEALTDYNAVLAATWNDFSPSSTANAASIAMELRQYPAAFNYYKQLYYSGTTDATTAQKALTGMLQSSFNAAKYDVANAYADTLLSRKDLPAEQISATLLYKAKASQQLGKSDTALSLYTQLNNDKDGEIAAESRYRIAEMLTATDSLTQAEAAANESIKLSAGYDTWIVRSYLLLADILTKQKDYFNAKATLNSIIKNTKSEEIKLEANARLATIKALEKQKSKVKDE